MCARARKAAQRIDGTFVARRRREPDLLVLAAALRRTEVKQSGAVGKDVRRRVGPAKQLLRARRGEVGEEWCKRLVDAR